MTPATTDPRRAAGRPPRASVTTRPSSTRAERLTFAELLTRRRAAARAFVAAGVQPGDRVAIWAPNSATWIVASFGVYLAGAVLVPLNTRYKGEEAGHVLRTSEARACSSPSPTSSTPTTWRMLDGVDGLEGARAAGACCRARSRRRARLGRVPRRGTTRLRRPSGTPRGGVARTTPRTSSSPRARPARPKGAMLTHGASVRTYAAWSELVGPAATATAISSSTRSSTPPG